MLEAKVVVVVVSSSVWLVIGSAQVEWNKCRFLFCMSSFRGVFWCCCCFGNKTARRKTGYVSAAEGEFRVFGLPWSAEA